ncbi:uncharacterized protein LOC143735252 [Siphateles boraxobius]|uniref:uncharacterized protein LOC143735252 n=1 Tax=Siphateles boraxobius TaxID=180520 RepID=UPI0040635E93
MCDYCKMRVFILLLVCVLVAGVPGVSEHEVIVAKGVSVSLHTGVTTDQHEEIRWYYNDILIAEITGNLSKIFTDDQCDGDTERFRDRLKLDHQTGSLTITNIRYTDSGVYHLQFNSRSDSEKIFKVIVWGISVGKQKNIAEGGSILLDAGVMKQNEMVTWYFNDTLIALVTGDLSKICTDVQWKDSNDRFRDRLKLNYRFSWSLIITNMSFTDSGLYTLKINKSSFSIMRSVTVTVTVPSLIHAVATAVLVLAVCSCCTLFLCQKDDRMQLSDREKFQFSLICLCHGYSGNEPNRRSLQTHKVY